MTSRCWGEETNAATSAATMGPTSGTCWMRAASAANRSSNLPKFCASARAVASPTCGIPRPYNNRGKVVCLLFSMASIRLAADFSPIRSRPESCSRVRA